MQVSGLSLSGCTMTSSLLEKLVIEDTESGERKFDQRSPKVISYLWHTSRSGDPQHTQRPYLDLQHHLRTRINCESQFNCWMHWWPPNIGHYEGTCQHADTRIPARDVSCELHTHHKPHQVFLLRNLDYCGRNVQQCETPANFQVSKCHRNAVRAHSHVSNDRSHGHIGILDILDMLRTKWIQIPYNFNGKNG